MLDVGGVKPNNPIVLARIKYKTTKPIYGATLLNFSPTIPTVKSSIEVTKIVVNSNSPFGSPKGSAFFIFRLMT